MRGLCALILASVASLAWPALAGEAPADAGQVELPREVYDRLMEQARQPQPLPRGAPAPWALGDASISASVAEADGEATATVSVSRAYMRVSWA